jgi:type VI secretion system FHA domain protein
VTLSLEITSPNLDGAHRHTFDETGGTIGRHPDNSWVLPHPKVSAHHAVIACRKRVFTIEHHSTNGIGLRSTRNQRTRLAAIEPEVVRLTRGRAYSLNSGDVLFIGPYEIRVSVRSADRDAADRVRASNTEESFPGLMVDSDTVDPIQLLGGPARRAKPAAKEPANEIHQASLLQDPFQPPDAMRDPALPSANVESPPSGYDPLAPDDSPAAPPSGLQQTSGSFDRAAALSSSLVIPEGYDPLATDDLDSTESLTPSAPLLPSPPVTEEVESDEMPAVPWRSHAAPLPSQAIQESRAASAQRERTSDHQVNAEPGSRADFSLVLAAAGLDPAVITPDVVADFGRILRIVVSGLMDVLRSRQQIKDEFRMSVTRVKPAENNPLKFSANVDDALHNLLVKRNSAYLGAVDAFEDAFGDVKHHQIAMLAGIRAAFESMLVDFDPDRMQDDFDRQMSKGLVPAKMRYWELYRDRLEKFAGDPETTFRRLFGDAFARAYEDQMRQLKTRDRSGGNARENAPELPDL